jgi:hypothetical protein
MMVLRSSAVCRRLSKSIDGKLRNQIAAEHF